VEVLLEVKRIHGNNDDTASLILGDRHDLFSWISATAPHPIIPEIPPIYVSKAVKLSVGSRRNVDCPVFS
jgi:hypothetical protein